MKRALLLPLLLSTFTVSCISDGDSGDVATDPTAKIALNGLSPTGFTLNISSVKLTTTSAAAQASTDAGRNGLSYLVGCALAPAQSFTITVDRIPYTYYGALGTAPAWLTRALTTTEANSVSACLYSRLNRDSLNVSISARGANGGFSTTSDELTNYTLEEGAFWGNVFTNLGTVGGTTCVGVDKLATPDQGQLTNRHCAEDSTQCGMTWAGHCADICTMSNGYYTCTYGGATITDAATIYVVNH